MFVQFSKILQDRQKWFKMYIESLRIHTTDIIQTKISENPNLRCMVSSIGPIFIQTHLIPSLLCVGPDFSPFWSTSWWLINFLASTNFFYKTAIVEESSICMKIAKISCYFSSDVCDLVKNKPSCSFMISTNSQKTGFSHFVPHKICIFTTLSQA